MARATATTQCVPVSERALIQRINRRLKQDGEQLRSARSEQAASSVGRYYIVDTTRNFIAYQRVELEELGRKLGVLQPWEALQEEQ
jgi:hypothetical protein